MKSVRLNQIALILITLLLINCSKDTPVNPPTPVIKYNLAVTVSPDADCGTVSPSSGSFTKGSIVQLTSTPATGFIFKEWSGGATGTANPVSVTMNANVTVNATFEKRFYPLNIIIEGEGIVNEELITQKTSYEFGTTVKLTPIASDEWEFVEWTGDLTGSENPVEVTISDSTTITALFMRTSNPLTIIVEGEGTVSEEVVVQEKSNFHDRGTIVKLTPTPSTGWEFKEWTGDLTGTENPVEITVNDTTDIICVFQRKSYPLKITIEGEGAVAEEIIAQLKTAYEFETVVKLTPTASTGWEFVEWTGDLTGSENPAQIAVNDSTNIKCIFQRKSYPINITIDGDGSVTEELIAQLKTTYKYEDVIKLTPVATLGWEFIEWTGDLTGSENPAQITVSDSSNITCVFRKKKYPLNITIEGGGTVTEEIIAQLKSTYEHGDVIKLTPTPSEYWMFIEWQGDITGSVNPVEITITDTTTITCVFKLDNDGDGVIDELDNCPNTPTGVTINEHGCQITFVPDDNFELYLIDQGWDDVLDNYVFTNNIESITHISCDNKSIRDLTGIEDFKSLEFLSCSQNLLTNLDLSRNLDLIELMCQNNQLSTLDLSNNIKLRQVYCHENSLSELDLSNNTNLTELLCMNNQLSSLIISSSNLNKLHCSTNQLTSLELSELTSLTELYCEENNLESLDVSNITLLITLVCNTNNLNALDLSNNTLLTSLSCYANASLSCIQVNQTQFDDIPAGWNKDGSSNYSVDCSGS